MYIWLLVSDVYNRLGLWLWICAKVWHHGDDMRESKPDHLVAARNQIERQEEINGLNGTYSGH